MWNYHIGLSPSIFKENQPFPVDLNDFDSDKIDFGTVPFHSTIIELTLEMIKILLETKCGPKDKSKLYFSTLNHKSIPIQSYSKFKDFISEQDFFFDEQSKINGVEQLISCLKDESITSGFIFCTLEDLNQLEILTSLTTLTNIQSISNLNSKSNWDIICLESNEKIEDNKEIDELKIKYSQTSNITFTSLEELRPKWLSVFKKKYSLLELRIQGIPMKQQKSLDSTDSYEVPLLCTASSFKISDSIFGSKVDTLNFAWRKNDPHSNIFCHHQLISSYPVVVLEPNSNVSKCLISFIGKGRAATIELLKSGQPQNIATHMIVMQDNQAYIHVINRFLMYECQCVHSKTFLADYRCQQLNTIISQQNMIYDSNSFFDKDEKISELIRKNLITMRYKGYFYQTPRVVEKITRIFPLQFDRESILWNEEIPQSIMHVLQPLIKIINKDNIKESDVDQARVFIADIHRMCTLNETYLFSQLKEDHKKRHYLHKRLWYDIRLLLSSFKAERFLSMTDDLWPHFYYNPEEIEKSCAPRDSKGNIIIPFNAEDNVFVISLGNIVWDKPLYHDNVNIFPIGYHITRNITLKETTSKYHFEIRNGGDEPQFVIYNDSNQEQIYIGRSYHAVYISLMDSRNRGVEITEDEALKSFGLSLFTIKYAISELPKADKIERSFPFQYSSHRKFLPSEMDEINIEHEKNSLEMGKARRNAYDTNSITNAIQIEANYLEHRNTATFLQNELVDKVLGDVKWGERTSLLSFHLLKMQKRSEFRTGFNGTHKALFTEMYSDEPLIMDNIVSNETTTEKKSKKRKSSTVEMKIKRRRKDKAF